MGRDEVGGREAAPAAASLTREEIAARLREVAPAILRVARGLVDRDADAEDAAQESLIELARALPKFRGDSSLETFATRIAIRTTLRIRKRGRAHEAKVAAFDAVETDRADPDPTAAQRRALLRGLLDDLPPPQAEALALRFVLGYSLPEIAETSGAPVNTVRSRIRLAREALERRLEKAPELRDALEPTS